jgi:hypothetical protein
MSFLKSLFGKLSGGGASEPESEGVEHNGFTIHPTPYAEGGQYQTAGRIVKVFDSGLREYKFIRAEKHPSRDDAIAFSITKGRQIIDEQGDGIFGRT